jgi:deazaflavin-dependent oxidoreductase (nitroreductase family)
VASRSTRQTLEREFFRTLNRVIEPMVRAGIGSPRIVPGGLIVLETTGRKSGRKVRIPLAATRFGGHVVVATARGKRSQWVLNLAAEPNARLWIGGGAREARGFVIHEGKRFRVPKSLPRPIQHLVSILAPYRKAGWAFAVLSPRSR